MTLAACGGPADETVARVSDAWGDCEEGEGRCGRISVPLRLDGEGAATDETLSLRVRILPSRATQPAADPLFVLVGGPGQAASEVGPLLRPVLDKIRAQRDVVLFDQRGTGDSSPLDCEFPDEHLSDITRSDFPADELERCLASYEVDPAQFTTEHSVADIEAVRVALGYPKINLFGLSYGTRLGLAYLRRHSEVVRSAVFDGVAPPTRALPSDMDVGAQSVLSMTLEACTKDPICAARFPELPKRTKAWVEALDRTPLRLELPHPRTGVPQPFMLDGGAALGTLRAAAYVPESAALIPWTIDAATRGDYRPWVGLLQMGQGTGDTISTGAFLSIVCAEDLARAKPIESTDEAPNFFAGRMFDMLSEACGVWPRGEVPKDHAEPVVSEVATLLLSGELDPATPPEWATEASRTLSNSRHLIVPGTGHGTWSRRCVDRLIADFVETGSSAGLDFGCVEGVERAALFVGPAGPATAASEARPLGEIEAELRGPELPPASEVDAPEADAPTDEMEAAQ